MGIVNLTEDSFFRGSRFLCPDGSVDVRRLVERCGSMLEEGADIIDIGAASSRPGASPVGAEVEWSRLETALTVLNAAFPEAKFSVDTVWASVVRRVFDLIGPFLVNDISAGREDPKMLRTVGSLGLPYVAMHSRGTPETMQSMTDYTDVVQEVKTFFREFSGKARDEGIRDWILDPGFGFAKTMDQNYQLLANLRELTCFGRPILVGISRKSMIYRLLKTTPEESLQGSLVMNLLAFENGASILRVHDVAETVAAFASIGIS